MFQMFICGTNTISHQEQDDDQLWKSPSSTPRKSRKNNKNPYSNRGLDKFSALLAELEEKRKQIYSQTGSQDIVVRFKYKNSTDVVPIVVKIKDEEIKKKTNNHQPTPTNVASEKVLDKNPVERMVEREELKTEKNKKKSYSWSLHKWRRPSYYLPAFLIMILFLLVFFGRSVTILFTCIGWYVIPTLQRHKRSKKDHVRKQNEKLLAIEGHSSPRSKRSSPARDKHR